MEGSRAVAETPTHQNSRADESRMDIEGEETEKFEGTEHQTTNNDEMDDEGEEGDDSRRSTVPNTRRRIATKNITGKEQQ